MAARMADDELARILAKLNFASLAPAEAAIVIAALGESAAQRANRLRLAERDNAIRTLAADWYPSGSLRSRSHAIADDLARCRAGNTPPSTARRQALGRVVELCGDHRPGWRRICDILAGAKTLSCAI